MRSKKAQVPAKRHRKPYMMIRRAIAEGFRQDGRCGDPGGPLALARLPGGSQNITGRLRERQIGALPALGCHPQE